MSFIKTSAIIPAHNESETVAKVVKTVMTDVDEVIVVDSWSSDDTAQRASDAGAKVIRVETPGKHHAIRHAIMSAKGQELVFVDADLANPPPRIAWRLLTELRRNRRASIAKGYYKIPFGSDPEGGGRLTELCVRPLLMLFFPELSFVRKPLSGEFAVYRKDLLDFEFTPGFAVDLGILLHCSKKGAVVQVDLGTKIHKHRTLFELGKASVEVAATILRASGHHFSQVTLEQYIGGKPVRSHLNLEPLASIEDSIELPLESAPTRIRKRQYVFPEIYESFAQREKKAVGSVIDYLSKMEHITCLIWGGSTTIGSTRQPFADVDLWLVTSYVPKIKKQLSGGLLGLKGLSFIHDAGYLPWLGELVSLFFFSDCSFSIDIGICDMSDLATANAGPSPLMIFGESQEAVARLRYQKYYNSPAQRIIAILVNLIKIRKDLCRGYLWNAIEYITRARRELIGLLTINSEPKTIRYSRADRDVESAIRIDDLLELAHTCPDYTPECIAECASVIANKCINWAMRNKADKKIIQYTNSLLEWLESYKKKRRCDSDS